MIISRGTGTGPIVRQTSPTLITPTLGVASATSLTINSSVLIAGAAANSIEQRNSTAAQTYRLYETYTDASNYSRLSISAPASGPITFASEAAGTGTVRPFKFTTANGIHIVQFNGLASGGVVSYIDAYGRFTGPVQTLDGTSGYMNTSAFQGKSSYIIQWSSDATWYGTSDAGVGRNAAGVVEVNNGTAGTLRDLKLRAIEMVDGNIVLSTSTGTKIGTATSQKLGLWNVTPIIQPAAAGQAAITDSTGGTPASSLVDVGVVFSQSAINANFATTAVLLLAMRTAMVNSGLMKGAA